MNIILAILLPFVGLTSALKLAQPCQPEVCKLPMCKCSTTSSGSNITEANIPQIVMLTFDDAVTGLTYDIFKEIFFGLKNPDGCPIGITHFLSHEYTDYTRVHDLWKRGHEIALHSVSHTADHDYWKNVNLTTFKAEFGDMREITSHFAAIPRSDIRGSRLPFLQTSGNVSFQGLLELGLAYDSSLPTRRYIDPALWPYTLEYESLQDCNIQPCPTASFPNIWEVPMTMWLDEKEVPCSMVDACTNIPDKTNLTAGWMLQQFNRHYRGSRAPFPVFMHAAWFFRNPEYLEGYKLFLKQLQELSDVYLVTVNKAIEWVKNPKPHGYKKPFGECEIRVPIRDCHPLNCGLKMSSGEERWMNSCVDECPIHYPWLGNPLGK
ncbi:uncharacterized protein LOC105696312 [Orussus abietinus]|uniref:uncharacterized protein LOC105696312 n=1 Tax=Orussus abietinus TaxID=222816 RepID=UPI0006267C5A|nr:uncharacterized protein LOC105696312 [Orussus abietinus]